MVFFFRMIYVGIDCAYSTIIAQVLDLILLKVDNKTTQVSSIMSYFAVKLVKIAHSENTFH